MLPQIKYQILMNPVSSSQQGWKAGGGTRRRTASSHETKHRSRRRCFQGDKEQLDDLIVKHYARAESVTSLKPGQVTFTRRTQPLTLLHSGWKSPAGASWDFPPKKHMRNKTITMRDFIAIMLLFFFFVLNYWYCSFHVFNTRAAVTPPRWRGRIASHLWLLRRQEKWSVVPPSSLSFTLQGPLVTEWVLRVGRTGCE